MLNLDSKAPTIKRWKADSLESRADIDLKNQMTETELRNLADSAYESDSKQLICNKTHLLVAGQKGSEYEKYISPNVVISYFCTAISIVSKSKCQSLALVTDTGSKLEARKMHISMFKQRQRLYCCMLDTKSFEYWIAACIDGRL